MTTPFTSRTIGVSCVALLLANPAAVYAAYTSNVANSIAAMTGDAAGDTLTITQSGGLFSHNRFPADPGFNSAFDFDSGIPGDQTVSATTGIITLNAGGGNDTIALGDGINLRGPIDGGPGTDTLDYSAYTDIVTANLGLGTTGLSATLGPDQESPPTSHAGRGTATVTNYNIVTHRFDITVTTTGLPPADVIGFHIHLGVVGVNGLILVDFMPPGGLTPDGTGFTFSATGLTMGAIHEAAFLGGGTYVNIHTAAFPTGAIRGQLFSGGNSTSSTGAATGTTGIANFENVTGGTGNDSLVGNFSANTINGGPGGDSIVAGPGGDVLNGGAGGDMLMWSNGDGTDVVEGGTEVDTVQVNGSTTSGDDFTLAANGTRLELDRTNLGLFSLDIGTVETVIVNGAGGADTFTVNDLAGVASLATMRLNGFDGADAFTFSGASAGAVISTVNGGTDTDTVTGPNSANTWNVTAANQGNIFVLTTLFSFVNFVEALVGGNASDTFNVKAFASGTPSVSGGAGSDTLNYDAELRPHSGDRIPPDGVINSPGVQPVTFTQMETVTILNRQPFTDPTLTSTLTVIKAAHVNELRTRINTVRADKGLVAFVFTDSPLSVGGTPIRDEHVLELRTALADAYVAASMAPPTYSAPVPGPGVLVMAAAIAELRSALIAIE